MDFLSGQVTPRDWAFTIGIIGIAAVIGAGFFMFIHQPQMDELGKIKKNDEVLVKDLEQAQQIAASIDDLKDRMAKIETLVDVFEERLPSQHEIPSLLIQFEEMAAEEELYVELNSLSRSADGRKETIPYRVIAKGNFHQIISFINKLERFKRYLKITDLEIKPVEDLTTEAEFTMNTYRFLKKEES
jgi:Tfp pilus assembly protein PilO